MGSDEQERMRTSLDGLRAICKHEGLRLNAYRDPVGVLTIGYGHTKGVREGQEITEAQAFEFLREDVTEAELCVHNRVQVPLEQAQFDALVSFVFNLGCGALTKSTLLRKLNAGDIFAAADQFLLWVHAGGHELPGLVKRRSAERAMFLTGSPKTAPDGANAGDTAPAMSAEAQAAPAVSPAPIPEPPTKDTPMPLPAFVAAAIPALIGAIPDLVNLFGKDGSVSERNMGLATKTLDIIVEATGKSNAQEAVEAIQADPELAQGAAGALRANWFELEEVAGGIAAAREANAPSTPIPRLGVRFHELLTLLIVTGAYGIGGAYLFTGSPAPEMAAALVTALVISAMGGIVAYWFGSTSGSALKSELLARKN